MFFFCIFFVSSFPLLSDSPSFSGVVESLSFYRICSGTLLPALLVSDSIPASASFSSDVKPAFSESSSDIKFSFSRTASVVEYFSCGTSSFRLIFNTLFCCFRFYLTLTFFRFRYTSFLITSIQVLTEVPNVLISVFCRNAHSFYDCFFYLW